MVLTLVLLLLLSSTLLPHHQIKWSQFDIRGNALGLLTAHPVTPLVSIHSLDQIDPLFPGMNTLPALQHFFRAANTDPQRVLQQTVCYDRWFSWTISVSWGYAIQVFPNHVYLPDAIKVAETFRHWRRGNPFTEAYVFNTRELHPDQCARPTIFFFEKISKSKGRTKTTYKRSYVNCSYDSGSPRKIKEIRVYAHKMDLTKKQVSFDFLLKFGLGLEVSDWDCICVSDSVAGAKTAMLQCVAFLK